MNWLCNFWGIHDWEYKSIRIFGSLSWGTWSVSSECKKCGKTSFYYIQNRKRAEEIEKIIEDREAQK